METHNIEFTKDYSRSVNSFEGSMLSDSHHHKNLNTLKILIDQAIIAFPAIIFNLSINFQMSLNLIFIGLVYDSPEMTNAIGISSVYINTIAFSIIVGLLSAFDTLGSNAFSDRKYPLIGVYYYKGMTVCAIYALPLCLLNYFAIDKVATYITNDPLVAEQFSLYTKICFWLSLVEVVNQANYRFLNIIGKSKINLFLVVILTCFHFVWCYVFIQVLRLGIIGAALAICTTQIIHTLLTSVYLLYFKPLPGACFLPTWECFHNLSSYYQIAWKSLLTNCLDYWTYQIMLIVASFQPMIQYSAHVIATNVYLLVFQTSKGFGVSVNILTARYIIHPHGNKRDKFYNFKRILKICFSFMFCVVMSVNLIIFLMKDWLLGLFTSNEILIYWAKEILLITLFVNPITMFWLFCSNVLKGLAKFDVIYRTNVLSFLTVQILGLYLFTKVLDLEIRGVWISNLVAFSVSSIVFVCILYNVNLHQCKDEAMRKIKSDWNDINYI